jgi:hypothetical protein
MCKKVPEQLETPMVANFFHKTTPPTQLEISPHNEQITISQSVPRGLTKMKHNSKQFINIIHNPNITRINLHL